jgi:hypothetical protein
MYTDHGTYIIGFSLSKKHLAVGLETFSIDALSQTIQDHGYEHLKMIVKFPWEKVFEYSLLKTIIEYNISVKQQTNTFWYKQ